MENLYFCRTATRPTPSNSATNSLEKRRPPMKTGSENGSIGDADLPAKPILSEDYAEIGIGEEEGDYSTPAARNYELDRSQITLNEIIGIGQFGDVHIGTCRIKQHSKSLIMMTTSSTTDNNGDHKMDELSSSTSSLISETTTTENGDGGGGEHVDTTLATSKTGIIHVAVKTCKADADITTAEKFLEEACTLFIIIFINFIILHEFKLMNLNASRQPKIYFFVKQYLWSQMTFKIPNFTVIKLIKSISYDQYD